MKSEGRMIQNVKGGGDLPVAGAKVGGLDQSKNSEHVSVWHWLALNNPCLVNANQQPWKTSLPTFLPFLSFLKGCLVAQFFIAESRCCVYLGSARSKNQESCLASGRFGRQTRAQDSLDSLEGTNPC
jgi:hypothetical protein